MTDQPTPEQMEAAKAAYYNGANGAGYLMNELFRVAGSVGPLAGSPHYRAIAGGGLTANALTELAEFDREAAKQVFQELCEGLLSLGAGLGLREDEAAEGTDATTQED